MKKEDNSDCFYQRAKEQTLAWFFLALILIVICLFKGISLMDLAGFVTAVIAPIAVFWFIAAYRTQAHEMNVMLEQQNEIQKLQLTQLNYERQSQQPRIEPITSNFDGQKFELYIDVNQYLSKIELGDPLEIVSDRVIHHFSPCTLLHPTEKSTRLETKLKIARKIESYYTVIIAVGYRDSANVPCHQLIQVELNVDSSGNTAKADVIGTPVLGQIPEPLRSWIPEVDDQFLSGD